MKKTLLENYLGKTTSKQRHLNPREEGIIAVVSDMIEREDSFLNLPKALPKIHEFHKSMIDRNRANDEEELKTVAQMFDFCLAMMIIDKGLSRSKIE